jgi:hypothetical protein
MRQISLNETCFLRKQRTNEVNLLGAVPRFRSVQRTNELLNDSVQQLERIVEERCALVGPFSRNKFFSVVVQC